MRRVVFYHFYDPRGQVDDYVLHQLRELRPHVEHIVLVSNIALQEAGREALGGVCDEVVERDNAGFDVWAFRETFLRIGRSALQEYDELLLMNCTFFGPVGSFAPVFEEMDADRDVDFWGLTEHAAVEPHPFDTTRARMEAHLQSHWLGVRRSVFTSDAWAAFWDAMPMPTTYLEAVSLYEAEFTAYFAAAGFRHRALFPVADFPSQHPIMDTPALMLEAGCPIVKRRALFRDPLYLESRAVDGRDLLDRMVGAGYPAELVLANLARTTRPRDLVTNLGMLEVLPGTDAGYDPSRPLRIIAIVHIFYPEMTDELVDRLDTLPGGYDLVITTPSADRAAAIRSHLDARLRSAEIRVVDNQGRDMAALLVGCRDLIEGDDHDLIVRLHSKKSPQDEGGIGLMFRRHLVENLLASPGHSANVVKLFQDEPTLGMVIPPTIHIGYPTMGHAWFANREPAERLAAELGIDVPFDEATPLAAYGSMFVARPAALRPLLRKALDYSDFPDNSGYVDGAITHVLERLVCYGSLSEGLHVREVLSPHMAAINYSFLEYKYQAVAAGLPGRPGEQIDFIHRSKQRIQRLRKRVARLQAERDALAATQLTLAQRAARRVRRSLS